MRLVAHRRGGLGDPGILPAPRPVGRDLSGRIALLRVDPRASVGRGRLVPHGASRSETGSLIASLAVSFGSAPAMDLGPARSIGLILRGWVRRSRTDESRLDPGGLRNRRRAGRARTVVPSISGAGPSRGVATVAGDGPPSAGDRAGRAGPGGDRGGPASPAARTGRSRSESEPVARPVRASPHHRRGRMCRGSSGGRRGRPLRRVPIGSHPRPGPSIAEKTAATGNFFPARRGARSMNGSRARKFTLAADLIVADLRVGREKNWRSRR